LREHSYAVDVAPDGEEALYCAGSTQYDLIILDVMLPVRGGYAVCRELRRGGARTPILMLTARDSVADRVTGLDCGADDYLTKPFEFKELLARLRALARRASALRPESLRVAGLELNTATHTASRAGRAITLTAKEYALLEFLMLNENRVVGREEIAQHVWDENFDPFSNTIDVHIRRLRAKIDTGFPNPLIHTRRGEGYLLSATGGGGGA
jgi:two-component system copper resistance phosphate regulon response regulator CusR